MNWIALLFLFFELDVFPDILNEPCSPVGAPTIQKQTLPVPPIQKAMIAVDTIVRNSTPVFPEDHSEEDHAAQILKIRKYQNQGIKLKLVVGRPNHSDNQDNEPLPNVSGEQWIYHDRAAAKTGINDAPQLRFSFQHPIWYRGIRDGTFSQIIVDGSTIKFMEPRLGILEQFSRMLKPGGQLIFEIQTENLNTKISDDSLLPPFPDALPIRPEYRRLALDTAKKNGNPKDLDFIAFTERELAKKEYIQAYQTNFKQLGFSEFYVHRNEPYPIHSRWFDQTSNKVDYLEFIKSGPEN